MNHHCHACNCAVEVPPEMLFCLRHWRMTPKALQAAVWASYREGQCDDGNPSEEWHKAADACIEHVYKKENPKLVKKY